MDEPSVLDMLNLWQRETGQPTKWGLVYDDMIVESVVASCWVPGQIRDHRSTVFTRETLALTDCCMGSSHCHSYRDTHAYTHLTGITACLSYEQISLQQIRSFWQFYIKKLLNVYSLVWINHVLVCIFSNVFFFPSLDWLLFFLFWNQKNKCDWCTCQGRTLRLSGHVF